MDTRHPGGGFWWCWRVHFVTCVLVSLAFSLLLLHRARLSVGAEADDAPVTPRDAVHRATPDRVAAGSTAG